MAVAAKKSRLGDEPIYIDLKTDSLLLDPKFELYRLSLESLPKKKKELDKAVYTCQPSESQWSFQHVQMFSAQNHLHADRWSDEGKPSLFVVTTEGDIQSLQIEKGNWTDWKSVFQLKFPDDLSNRSDRYNVTLSFPSPQFAFVSDGTGRLVLCHTGDRSGASQWKELLVEEALEDPHRGFILVDSVAPSTISDGETKALDCLISYVADESKSLAIVTDDEAVKSEMKFVTHFKWISFQETEGKWGVSRTRALKTFGSSEFASLSSSYDGICIASSAPVAFISDSKHPVKPKVVSSRDMSMSIDAPVDVKIYSWGQTGDDVCVVFTLPAHIEKEDVRFELAHQSMLISYGKPGEDVVTLLDGKLGGDVEVGTSVWTLLDHKLEVTLQKQGGSMWTELVIGDRRGEYVPDPELVQQAHESLMKLTTENPNSKAHPELFNNQDLEECDTVTSEVNFFGWIDGETHKVSYEADIGGRQWLFSTRLSPSEPKGICLRHDVDGLVWKIEGNPSAHSRCWSHLATFNAFGYVQASKEQRRFCCCPPDCSYAAIVDVTKHAYVYWQAEQIETELRHRQSGRQVSHVSKQQLVTLDGDKETIGAVALNSFLFLLTADSLYCVDMTRGNS